MAPAYVGEDDAPPALRVPAAPRLSPRGALAAAPAPAPAPVLAAAAEHAVCGSACLARFLAPTPAEWAPLPCTGLACLSEVWCADEAPRAGISSDSPTAPAADADAAAACTGMAPPCWSAARSDGPRPSEMYEGRRDI
mmetsp:Transcript_2849/g.7473  ORF Transcript_2849/g.7473 Transcript_2849/m.7473 type:complete len:138 (+) Transcript_2849:1422-1835(+)